MLLTAFTPLTVFADQTALGEASSFDGLVSIVWSYGSQIILGFAVFFIVLGAFFYVLSAGNDERITTGKQLIFGALVAILIVLSSGVILQILHRPAEGATGSLAEIPTVIRNATNILTGLIGVFTVIMMSYSGILYATASGDTEKILKARRAFQYALIGFALGALAYALVNALVNYLRLN